MQCTCFDTASLVHGSDILYRSGNFIFIASTSSCILALTWGGAIYPWSSARVLVPLLVGLGGMAVFLAYEARFAKYPMVSSAISHAYLVLYSSTSQVPFLLLSNRTSLIG